MYLWSISFKSSLLSCRANPDLRTKGNMLICHSAGIVLRQPPLTQDAWTVEINKMRNAFGAPLPADQAEALAKYLRSINGQSPNGPSAVDGQGS